MSKTLYTCEEAANILDVVRRTVHSYIKKGSLKAEKLGCMWAIHKKDLDEFQHKLFFSWKDE
jgi:excisionase family DNA binding protein